jgi:acyl-CoA synthetase (AMP-forming)/AMP-acid ligase II
VGGAKVSAVSVEETVLSLDGVVDARVYGIPSPVLGQLVGLEYCGHVDEDRVRRFLDEKLSRIERPSEIVRRDAISLSPAHKKRRSASDV